MAKNKTDKTSKNKANSRNFKQKNTQEATSSSGSAVASNAKTVVSGVKSIYSSYSSNAAKIQQTNDNIQNALSDGKETTAAEYAAMYEQQAAYEREQLKAILSGVKTVATGMVKTLAAIPTDIKKFIPDSSKSKVLSSSVSESDNISSGFDSFKSAFSSGFGSDFDINAYAEKYDDTVSSKPAADSKNLDYSSEVKAADKERIERQTREAASIVKWDSYDDNEMQIGK